MMTNAFFVMSVCLGVQAAALYASVQAAARSKDGQQSLAVLVTLSIVGAGQGLLFGMATLVPQFQASPDDYYPPSAFYGFIAVFTGLLVPLYFVIYFFVRAALHVFRIGSPSQAAPGTGFLKRSLIVYGSAALLPFLPLLALSQL
jgi:hypothetical protein